MYMCWDCCREFYYEPDEIEIRTADGNLMIVDVCPFCKSDNIEEVDDVYDAEVR